MKDFFFCVCSCGSLDYIEVVQDKETGKNTERVNHLTKEGDMQFKWKIDIHLHDKFSKMKPMQIKFYTKWVSYDYEDLICFNCENRLHPIPFSDIDKKQRIDIFNMTDEERIDFANNYKMVKVLEKEK
jgi:hypothetical protein